MMAVSPTATLGCASPLIATSGRVRARRVAGASPPGLVHLRRLAVVLTSLALLGLAVVLPDRAARPNGPAAWHVAGEAAR